MKQKKAGRKKRDWLGNIQEGKMREIARLFFLTYVSKAQATKYLYSDRWQQKRKLHKNKRGYVAPEISKRIKEWQELNFIETSRLKVQYYRREKQENKQIEVKDGKPAYAYLMNLEPFYKFCKEKHNIDFTQKEKDFLNGVVGLFRSEHTRKLILQEYPEEDIINAILKFYIKNYVEVYGYFLKIEKILSNSKIPISQEAIKEIEKAKKKAEDINKNKFKFFKARTFKEFKQDYEKHKINYLNKQTESDLKKMHSLIEKSNKEMKEKNYDFIDVLSLHSESNFIENGFHNYVNECKKNPKLVFSVDGKFMKALGILPL